MPALPPRMFRDEPTGKVRFRRGWWGRLILQVELISHQTDPAFGEPRRYWVDAEDGDLWRVRYYRKQQGLEPVL